MLFNADNVDEYVATLNRGVEHLAGQLRRLQGPVTGVTPEQAEKLVYDVDLDRPLRDTDAALEELSRLYLDDAAWFHEPTYAAHLNCPVVIPALLGELFVSSVNSSLDTFDQSVGGTFIERKLVDWTAERIGFAPDTADGVFTSGGSQSNLQALLLARGQTDAALGRVRIFASSDSHFSVVKSATLLGLDADAVVKVPTDARRRMDVGELDRLLTQSLALGLTPMAVVATAGTTDFGAIDPMDRIATVTEKHGVWLHVDAAYGGGLLVSKRRRHLLAGIERADSVTVDYHKTYFQPVSSSALVVCDAGTLRHATYHADYLNPESAEHPNQVDKSLQTTRRFDALKLWMTLRIMGGGQVGDYFDAAIDLAHEVYDVLLTDPDFEVAAPPTLSTLVFRYRPPRVSEDWADELNPRLRSALFAGGSAVVAGTTFEGRSWLKFTLLNPEAKLADLLGVVDTLRGIGHELSTAGRAGGEPLGEPPSVETNQGDVRSLVSTDVRSAHCSTSVGRS